MTAIKTVRRAGHLMVTDHLHSDRSAGRRSDESTLTAVDSSSRTNAGMSCQCCLVADGTRLVCRNPGSNPSIIEVGKSWQGADATDTTAISDQTGDSGVVMVYDRRKLAGIQERSRLPQPASSSTLWIHNSTRSSQISGFPRLVE